MKTILLIHESKKDDGGVFQQVREIEYLLSTEKPFRFTVETIHLGDFINKYTILGKFYNFEFLIKFIRKLFLVLQILNLYFVCRFISHLIFKNVSNGKPDYVLFLSANPFVAFTAFAWPERVLVFIWDLAFLGRYKHAELSGIKERIYYISLIKANLIAACTILVDSETSLKIAVNFFGNSNKIKAAYFPLFLFKSRAERIRKHIPKGNRLNKRLQFFYPAQFWPHKNHTQVLDALSILNESSRNSLRVLFCGEDKGEKLKLIKKRNDLGLEDVVYFSSFLTDDEVLKIYFESHFVLYPSLLGPTNLPPLEGLICGCKPLVSDCHELFRATSCCFDPNSPSDLASKLESFTLGNQKNISDLGNQKLFLAEYERKVLMCWKNIFV